MGLSLDQTPYRGDERDRVKARGGGGARVATLDQIEGVKVRMEGLRGGGGHLWGR